MNWLIPVLVWFWRSCKGDGVDITVSKSRVGGRTFVWACKMIKITSLHGYLGKVRGAASRHESDFAGSAYYASRRGQMGAQNGVLLMHGWDKMTNIWVLWAVTTNLQPQVPEESSQVLIEWAGVRGRHHKNVECGQQVDDESKCLWCFVAFAPLSSACDQRGEGYKLVE